jgi:mannose-6-phosphate isomerase-like protein (cupin superfamily)
MPDDRYRVLRIRNDELDILAFGDETGGAYALIEMRITPGGGPPVHLHDDDDESFLVLEGRFRILQGDVIRDVGPGEFVFGPRRVPHAFTNIGETTGRLLVIDAPPRIEPYFRELARCTAEGTLTETRQKELYARYRMRWVAASPFKRSV